MTEWYSVTGNCIEYEVADRLRVAAAIWNLKRDRQRVYLVRPVEHGPGPTVIREVPAPELMEALSRPTA